MALADVVLCATPPGFRPQHFEEAVRLGKHVFIEKPVATDANGYYRMSSLAPGVKSVAVTPPSKLTRTFKVVVNNSPTQRDFRVDW